MTELTTDKRDKKPELLLRTIQHGPLIYALLVFVGFLNLHAYYRQFSIDIWTYLSTAELLLSFLPLSLGIMAWITLVVTVVVVNTLFTQAIVPHKHHKHEPKPNRKPHSHVPYTQARAWRRFRINFRRKKFMAAFGWLLQMGLFIVFIVYLFVGFFVMGVILNGTQLQWLPLGTLVPLILFWLLSFFGFMFNVMDEHEVKPIAIAAGILLGTATTYQVSVNRAIDVLDNSMNTTATITTSNQTIVTDSMLVYVGKLQNAVFLYDKRSGVGSAIPMSVVERIDLKTVQKGTFDIPDPKAAMDSLSFDSIWQDLRRGQ
jgi:hypothetical protein